MAQMQQVAQAGGQIAPLAKALPEEAKALVGVIWKTRNKRSK
jgi:hypothetical protein